MRKGLPRIVLSVPCLFHVFLPFIPGHNIGMSTWVGAALGDVENARGEYLSKYVCM